MTFVSRAHDRYPLISTEASIAESTAQPSMILAAEYARSLTPAVSHSPRMLYERDSCIVLNPLD
jgi:hypothetical protein